MATYVIGDVQGCFDALIRLLDKIKFDAKHDQLIFVGDLVNRGPHSLKTLQYIKSLGTSALTVLGNHDLHFLCVALGHTKIRTNDTFDDILQASNRIELIEWLRHQPLLIQRENYIITHAGIPPIWSTKKAKKRAKELENVIQCETSVNTYFASLYGDTPTRWNKELEGVLRWRMITNYFTRMRLCKKNGALEFKHKTTSSNLPDGYLPWFSHTKHKLQPNEKILFGHWAALEGKTDIEHAIALDTGCVWDGKLTAYCIERNQFFSVSAHKKC